MKTTTLLLLVLLLASSGCSRPDSPPPSSHPAEAQPGPLHFNRTFDLTVSSGDFVPSNGAALGSNCALLIPTAQDNPWSAKNGRAELAWNGSGLPTDQLSLYLHAEGADTPPTPPSHSPVALDLGAFNVTWEHAAAVVARVARGGAETIQHISLNVQFDYPADEADHVKVVDASCSLDPRGVVR